MWTPIVILGLSMAIVGGLAESGYSYHRFRGPVSGIVQKIQVPGYGYDYSAKPDYGYSYGVQDPYSGTSQGHHESRNGDTVHGEYRVLQADGLTRIVRYTADPHKGFQAIVTYEKI